MIEFVKYLNDLFGWFQSGRFLTNVVIPEAILLIYMTFSGLDYEMALEISIKDLEASMSYDVALKVLVR